MWLFLCESNDVSAIWAYQGLKTRGLVPAELIRSEMFELGVRWEHQVGAEGVYVDFTLKDGRRFRFARSVTVFGFFRIFLCDRD